MTHKRTLSLLLLSLALLSLAIPTGGATHGEQPTEACSQTFTATASTNYRLITQQGVQSRAVTTDNGLVFPLRHIDRSAPTDSFDNLYRLNTNCSIAWSFKPAVCEDRASSVDSCAIRGLHIDHAGRIAYIVNVNIGGNVGVFIEIRNPATGDLIKQSVNLSAVLAPAWQEGWALTSVQNGTDLHYVAADRSNSRIIRINRDLDTIYYHRVMTGGGAWSASCCITYENETSIITSGGTSNNLLQKIDIDAGTSGGSASASPLQGGTGRTTPILYYGSSTVGVWPHTGTGVLSYRNVTLAGPSIGAQTDFAPNQIYDGAVRVTSSNDWDLDSNDNLLICGEYSLPGPTIRGFSGHFKTTNNTMHWNITTNYGLTISQTVLCALDYGGAHWTGSVYDEAAGAFSVRINRYTGGEFVPIIERRTLVILPPDTIGDSGNPLDAALQFFNQQWGFDGSVLFGTAVFGLSVTGFAGIGKGRTILIALGAFVGVLLAVSLGFWEEWTIFLLLFVVIAVAGSKLFDTGKE